MARQLPGRSVLAVPAFSIRKTQMKIRDILTDIIAVAAIFGGTYAAIVVGHGMGL